MHTLETIYSQDGHICFLFTTSTCWGHVTQTSVLRTCIHAMMTQHILRIHTFYPLPPCPLYLHTSQSRMQTRKSTIIREGVYLADLESNASLHSSQLQDALNRPIPVPQYDPQSSLAMSGTTHNSVRSDVPPKPSMQRLASKDSTYRYREDQIKAVRQIGVKEASDKRSRLSFSPSVFQMGNGALSAKQTEKFARLQDAIPEHLQSSSKEPVINYTEPPDGGLMAWAHTVAGHLVVFNAQ